MGTDIHGVFQKRNKENNTWEDVETEYEFDRHYQLFAVLANVRNGTEFAGITTRGHVKPIAHPRGLPEDFVMTSLGHHGHHWLGDHSRSWLGGKEMLDWFASTAKVLKTGVVNREVYETWDKVSNPIVYSGSISGPQVITVNDNSVEKELHPNWTHIQCTWTSDLAEELGYFFHQVKRLQDLHGEIRFVFGFDS